MHPMRETKKENLEANVTRHIQTKIAKKKSLFLLTAHVGGIYVLRIKKKVSKNKILRRQAHVWEGMIQMSMSAMTIKLKTQNKMTWMAGYKARIKTLKSMQIAFVIFFTKWRWFGCLPHTDTIIYRGDITRCISPTKTTGGFLSGLKLGTALFITLGHTFEKFFEL